MESQRIHELLAELGISYDMVSHPPVFTCEEARRYVPELGGLSTKNLFLRDKNKHRYFLVSVKEEKAVDLKQLAEVIQSSKLSFGSAEDLKEILGLEPGSVSILALVNDSQQKVELVLDRDLWEGDAIQCHPLVNTETLAIPRDGLEKLLMHTAHQFAVVEIPERKVV